MFVMMQLFEDFISIYCLFRRKKIDTEYALMFGRCQKSRFMKEVEKQYLLNTPTQHQRNNSSNAMGSVVEGVQGS